MSCQEEIENCKQFKIIVNHEVELHCITKGSGQQPLLLIPGAIVSSDWSFHAQLDYFGRPDSGFTVIAYDPRGYGHSQLVERNFQVVPDHHLKIDAIDGYEIMKQLGYDKFYVLGWCDGGITAMYMAVLFPDSVEGIVIWGSRTSLTEYDLNITGVVLGSIEKFEPEYKKYVTALYQSEENAGKLWKKYVDSVFDLYKQTIQSNGRANYFTEELRQITCRTLILHGAKDGFSPISHAEYSNKLIKGSELQILPEGKHRLQAAQSFNRRVEKFLTAEQY